MRRVSPPLKFQAAWARGLCALAFGTPVLHDCFSVSESPAAGRLPWGNSMSEPFHSRSPGASVADTSVGLEPWGA